MIDQKLTLDMITVGEGGDSILVVTFDNLGITKLNPVEAKTITAKVYCYHSSVEDVTLNVLDMENLSVTVVTPSFDINPNEQKMV